MVPSPAAVASSLNEGAWFLVVLTPSCSSLCGLTVLTRVPLCRQHLLARPLDSGPCSLKLCLPYLCTATQS